MGSRRRVIGERARLTLVAALESVDLAVLFDEDTPERLIREVRPRVLVKGGDWAIESIVGREFVESQGGVVRTIRVREGLSTSSMLERILARAGLRLDSGTGDP
jgi:rfaE bifunctional protein nucleotidyltransferase chain/domain